MRALVALGLNDLRSVRRDSLLAFMVLIPWLLVLVVRVLLPAIESALAASNGFDLRPYYPLILGFLFVLDIPLLFGGVIGLLLLDQRDEDTLTALQVTPLSLSGYTAYRIGGVMLFSAISILVAMPLTGLLPLARLPALAPIALVAALLAPCFGLMLPAFAGNKVEGLAVLKAVSILIVGPLVAYFINSDWQLLLGLLPTYWPTRAFWVLSEGGSPWVYLLVGAIYNAVWIALLLRRFRARMYR